MLKLYFNFFKKCNNIFQDSRGAQRNPDSKNTSKSSNDITISSSPSRKRELTFQFLLRKVFLISLVIFHGHRLALLKQSRCDLAFTISCLFVCGPVRHRFDLFHTVVRDNFPYTGKKFFGSCGLIHISYLLHIFR